MSHDKPQSLIECIEALTQMDEVDLGKLKAQLYFSVPKRNTGDFDSLGNPIRERVVSEERFEELFSETEISYACCVDGMNDFHDDDRLDIYIDADSLVESYSE